MADPDLEEFKCLVKRAGLPVDEAELAALLPTYLDLQKQIALLDAHISVDLEPVTVFRPDIPVSR